MAPALTIAVAGPVIAGATPATSWEMISLVVAALVGAGVLALAYCTYQWWSNEDWSEPG